MNQPVIIGAGISGLSAANYFVDNGIQPILIDAGSIGNMKICGEFFSYESIPFLEKWEIPFVSMQRANFFINKNKYSFHLPKQSASTSRSMCEIELAKRAKNLGAIILTNTLVAKIIPAQINTQKHFLKLSNGKEIETDKLIITTSKFPFFETPKKINNVAYVGIKAHFTNFTIPNELNMYLIPGAYMGVTNIDNSTVNICCLAKKSLVEKFNSAELFMQFFLNAHSSLSEHKNAIKLNNWLTMPVSVFGKKSISNWPNSYFIGDAIATIYPASGNGLAMGLTSGIMAAHHIIFNLKSDFNKDWNSRYRNRLYFAKILHSIFISKKANTLFKIGNLFPKLSNTFYYNTRDNKNWRY